jgi:hypothetical protein
VLGLAVSLQTSVFDTAVAFSAEFGTSTRVAVKFLGKLQLNVTPRSGSLRNGILMSMLVCSSVLRSTGFSFTQC